MNHTAQNLKKPRWQWRLLKQCNPFHQLRTERLGKRIFSEGGWFTGEAERHGAQQLIFWAFEDKSVMQEMIIDVPWSEIKNTMIEAILYQREVDLLSNMQVNFLKAVCSEVEKFSANETLREFNLGSSANIKRVREALIEKEVIDMINGKPEFSDPLFKIWFWRIYMQRTRLMVKS